MFKNIVSIAVAVIAGGLCFVGQGIQVGHAQTITFGPNGMQVNPNYPPSTGHDYRRYDDGAYGNRYSNDHNYRWHEVRERMRDYRDECRDGNRSACVRLGIIIGQNQARRDEWQREHPSYFWWDRD